MFRFKLFALVLATLAFASFAADEENPYKSAKIGDWVEYKSNTEAQGFKMESKMKHSVTAKTDKEVTVAIEMDMNGQKHTQEMKIDLTQKYDPTTAGAPPGQKAPKVEKVKEGDETLTIGGKAYKSHWTESKMTMDAGGQPMETESKTWISKDAPLGGLVKMEMKMGAGMKTTMELTGSGTG